MRVAVLILPLTCERISDDSDAEELRHLCEEQYQAFVACDAIIADVTHEEFVSLCLESFDCARMTSEACRTATIEWTKCTRDAFRASCDHASAADACGMDLEDGC